MIALLRLTSPIGGALIFAAAAAHAENAYPVTAMPDIVGNCRASMPLDCPVPPGEKWQAMYRERCAEEPAQCTFRPDGTISRWVAKYTASPALVGAIRRVPEPHRSEQSRIGAR